MKVMLDRDLADLYGVETRVLKQAVRRNIERFPTDFMFEFSATELKNWRSQFVTSNSDRMGLRYAPMAFTEQGVAMLSTVLSSKRAISEPRQKWPTLGYQISEVDPEAMGWNRVRVEVWIA